MSDSMNDDVSSRFRAIWVGLLALLSFGVLSAVVVCMTSKDPSASDPVTELRAKKRALVVAEVNAAQKELVEKAARDDAAGTVRLPVDEAAKLVAPQLKAKKAAASQTVVPGSPTQIKQSQQSAPAAKAESEPEADKKAAPTPAPGTEAKPTTPAPAAKPTPAPKPATEKPAAPKPATAPAPAPAAKPATEKPAAPKPATEKPAAPKPATEKPATTPKPATPTPEPATPTPAPAKPAATPAPKPAAPAPAN